MWWLIPVLIGGAVVVRARKGSGGGGLFIPAGDGSKARPIAGVTRGVTDPNTLKGKWYTFSDRTGPWYFPSDADMRAFGKQIVDAALHNRKPPPFPPEWGPSTAWHASAGFTKIAQAAGSAVGAGIGFIAGGPVGAKAGMQAGRVISTKVFIN